MSLFLVDDQGEMWRGDSRQLRIAFDTPFSGGEFVDYSVRNLGFVAIDVYGASCQIRLRPAFAAQKAIMALIEWLGKSRIERAVLTIFDKVWRDELVKASKAVARIEQLMLSAQETRPPAFMYEPLPFNALGKDTQLLDVVQAWPNLITAYEEETLIRLLRSIFEHKYVIVSKPVEQDNIVFRDFGEGMYTRYDTWRTCAIGAPIEEQPDRNFGRWIAGLYREALRSEAPRLDAVDAIIRNLDAGRDRRRYRRIIFPLPSESNGKLLFCGSIDDAAIDLRVTKR